MLILAKKRLHQYMYQDVYFPDIDDNQKELNRLHNGKTPNFIPNDD
jgi:hypothetical protein